ncbi:MAG: N-formylglutamate amidohydrolase [Neomegalonema sp.]|nr:N-formylglutamate amidohydrolase [Neomegalonema sp.]
MAAARLSLKDLRASEDAFVEELFSPAISLGAPMISAVAPRAFVDLNRRPTELDPNLIDGAALAPHSTRVAAGLGVVPRIVAEGMPIYDCRLSADEAQARLDHWHTPYHRRLGRLLERARRLFGTALLIDCHSMPSSARSKNLITNGAEIILGDRFGSAAPPEYVCAIETSFRRAGFTVSRNAPFAGGYITERFGRPAAGVSAIQIEIDRGLYLDEENVRRGDAFHEIVDRLRPVAADICALITTQTGSLAAE